MSDVENRDVSCGQLRQAFQLAADAIEQLPEETRGVCVRLYVQKIPLKDVATELGLSVADVIDLATKALSRISSQLEGLADLQALELENASFRAKL